MWGGFSKADGTPLKENVGGNAITAASFAVANAGAHFARVELFEHLAHVFYKDDEVK